MIKSMNGTVTATLNTENATLVGVLGTDDVNLVSTVLQVLLHRGMLVQVKQYQQQALYLVELMQSIIL